MSVTEKDIDQIPALTMGEKIAASSQVAALAYDPTRRELTVEFKKGQGGAPPQFRYVYSDFPPDKWEELQAADSLGSYLYRNVTGGKGRAGDLPYHFTKIDAASGVIVDRK